MLERIKYLLTKIGRHTSEDGVFRFVDAALNYVEVGRWMRSNGYEGLCRLRTRREVFEHAAAPIAGERVLYLEFGVWKGESIRHWARLLRNPSSRLHGFDSFAGLPERWHPRKDAGHFSTGGLVPEIADPRVQFFKGWFQDTLPSYVPPEYDRLVINIDADLYSSTCEVLERFRELIQPGTFLYFDEFSDRNHELKAFSEFAACSDRRFRVVAATLSLSHVMFEVIA
jgi:hypothetical protein